MNTVVLNMNTLNFQIQKKKIDVLIFPHLDYCKFNLEGGGNFLSAHESTKLHFDLLPFSQFC